MTGGRSHRTQTAFALIALALWLRLLVPAGWMPAESGFGIRPCLPEASAPAIHDHHAADHRHGHGGHDAEKPKPEKPRHSGEICAFTALAMALDAPPLPPALPEALPTPTPPPALPLRQAAGLLALASPPPPATGPPA